jgi:hypothetical protein
MTKSRRTHPSKGYRRNLIPVVLATFGVLLLASSLWSTSEAAFLVLDLTPTAVSHLPVVAKRGVCPATSPHQYQQGIAYQYDEDNPVRPAYNHADKNIELRGYVRATDPALRRELVDLGCDDAGAPKLDTLFSPPRVPALKELYRVHDWDWGGGSPYPGQRTDPIANPPVTALGMATHRGETVRVPESGYDIGGGMEVLVLFADEDTVALRYAREDSVGGPVKDYTPGGGGPGYVVHVDDICTDPNLLTLYRTLDAPGGQRYVYAPPDERPYGYPLPALPAGKPIGTARGEETVVAVVDTGVFQDPRSLREFWSRGCGAGRVVPFDSDYTKQWSLETVRAPHAWYLSTGEDTVIAVLDTGVDLDHPDLHSKILDDQDWDFVNNDDSADDDHGHGTHVAGIAAAATDNAAGMAGLGWSTAILPLKVLGSGEQGQPTGTIADLWAAVDYAAAQGADVINLSLGAPGITCSSEDPDVLGLRNALREAYQGGVIIVAAGGSDGQAEEMFPANCEHVLGVSGTDRYDAVAPSSNWGSHISVAAPGGAYDWPVSTHAIYSTRIGGDYGWIAGSSMAAPHVAGLSALIASRFPHYTADQRASAVLDNAANLGPTGWDERYGCGRIDAYGSLIAGARAPAPLCLPITGWSERGEPEVPSITRAPFAPGEIILELRPGASPATLARQLGTTARSLHASNTWRLRVPEGQERTTAALLRADPAVLTASLNYLVFAQ